VWSHPLKKGRQLLAVVFPPLVMLSFKHRKGPILHPCVGQCRDEALSLPLVLVIDLLQDGSKGLNKRMILGRCIDQSLLLRNTIAPFMCVGKYARCLSGKRQIRCIQWGLAFLSALSFNNNQVLPNCYATPHEGGVDCATNWFKPGVWSCSTTDLTDTDYLPWPRHHAWTGRVAYQPEQSLCCRWLRASGWLEGLLSADALAEGF